MKKKYIHKVYRCPWCKARAALLPKEFDKMTREFLCGHCSRMSPRALTPAWAMLRWEREREIRLEQRRSHK